MRVTGSDIQVMSSKPRVTTLNSRVIQDTINTSCKIKAQVGRSKAQVRGLKTQVKAIKPRVK